MPEAPRQSLIRRIWKPVATTGASGTAAAIWFEEIMLMAETILALLLLPVLAGLIYLFNHFLFNTSQPRQEDLRQHGDNQ